MAAGFKIKVEVDTTEIDDCTEKVRHLIAMLTDAADLANEVAKILSGSDFVPVMIKEAIDNSE